MSLQAKAAKLFRKIASKTLNNISDEELNVCRVVLKKKCNLQ